MADNYLENRMEEYRSGRLAVRSRTTSAMRSPRRADTLVLRYGPMPVVILAEELLPVVAETVGAFTSVGCHVAFTAAGSKEGNAIAQRTGARYYPVMFAPDAILSDFTARRGALPAVIVTFLPGAFTVSASPVESAEASPRIIDATSWLAATVAPANIARHLLYLAHPDNAWLLDV